MAPLAPSPDLTARVANVLRNLFAMACEADGVSMPAKIILKTQKATVDQALADLSDEQAAEMANVVVSVVEYVTDRPGRKARLKVISGSTM